MNRKSNRAMCVAAALVAGLLSPIAAARAEKPAPPSNDGVESPLLDDRFAAIAAEVPEFGGLHIDERGKALVVNVTERRPRLVPDLRRAIRNAFPDEDLPNPIHLVDKSFSFTQLNNWKNKGRDLFAIDGVGLIDIDDVAGLLTIGVTEQGREAQIADELAARDIPPEGWKIEAVEPVEAASSVTDRHRPVMGGLQIQYSSGGLCTLGLAAFRQGVGGFITNSHCTNTQGGVESTQFAQPFFAADSSNTIGVETVDPLYFTGGVCPSGKRCRYSDSAFARLTSLGAGTATATRAIALPPVNSLSWNGTDRLPVVRQLTPLVGMVARKVGRSSGHDIGVVEAVCVDFPVAETNIVQLCQADATVTAIRGDSGSPVFNVKDCTVNGRPDKCAQVLGLIWGGGGVFSPMANIERSGELGSLLVCFTDAC